jgi:hypothetical protein
MVNPTFRQMINIYRLTHNRDAAEMEDEGASKQGTSPPIAWTP